MLCSRTSSVRPARRFRRETGMSLIRKFALCAAAAALSLGVTAAQAKTIALVTINQQALFFNQINDGAKEAAKAAGVDLVIHLSLIHI